MSRDETIGPAPCRLNNFRTSTILAPHNCLPPICMPAPGPAGFTRRTAACLSSFGVNSAPSCGVSRCAAAPSGAASGLRRKRRMRSRASTFLAKSILHGARAPARWSATRLAPLLQVALSLLPRSRRSSASLRRRELYSGAPSLRQADGNGLLRGTRPVFSFAHVFEFLTDELARLGGWRFSLFFVPFGPLNYLFFWHRHSFTAQKTYVAFT